MTRKLHAGYTLVELMVAVTLGLILTAGVISVFVSSKQGFRQQESSGRMQENMRVSIENLTRAIRQADFWSGVKTPGISGSPAVADYSVGTTCTGAWVTTVDSSGTSQGLVGYEGGSAPPIDCVAGGDYVAGSDMLALRYVDPNTYRDSGFSASNVYLRTSVAKRGFLFLGDSSGSAAADARIAVGPGVFNYEYRTSLIFLRPCSVKAGAACAASDDGGHPIPTLVSLDLQGTSLTQVPLVEGVETVQFLYGLRTGSDLAVNTYCTAAQINGATGACAGGWGRVMSVRVGVVARGDVLDNFTDTAIYTLPGGFTYGPPSCSGCSATYSAAAARYERRLIVKDVQVRNRTRV